MNTLILYFILANLGLAAFYLFFRLLLQKDTFFAGKRIALLVGIVLALTYPLLDLSSWIQRSDSLVAYTEVLREGLPEIPATTAALANEVGSTNAVENVDALVPVNTMESATALEPAIGTTPTNKALTPVQQPTTNFNKTLSFTLFDYILLIYLLTTAFLLFRITRQLLRIKYYRKHAERRYLHGQWVYVLKGCKSPFSFFKAVFMDPDAYSEKDQLDIIEHEKVHIRQVHSFDVLFSEGVCALFWINPFAWLLKRSLRENLEFLADNNVIKKGVDPKTYQYKLLQLSCHRSDANLANHFNVSQLKKRIVMMNKKRTSWKGMGKYALYLPLFAGLLLTAYAWGQQHETEAIALVEKATADSKLIEALTTTIDNTMALAQNVVKEKPADPAQNGADQTGHETDETPDFGPGATFTALSSTYRVIDDNSIEVAYARLGLVMPFSTNVISLSSGGAAEIDFEYAGKGYKINPIGPEYLYFEIAGKKYAITSIGPNAFADNFYISTIQLPSTVTVVESQAFKNCSNLISVNLPSSLKRIGSEAFSGCSNLMEITIPASVTSIGEKAFNDCPDLKLTVDPNNTRYTSVDGVIFDKMKTTLISYPNTTTSHYTLPSYVKSIGFRAFLDCTGLTSVTIPSSVTSLMPGAFKGCTGLTSVTIPSSVKTIESETFKGCTGLTSITLPSSVQTIGNEAFKGCTRLTSINIPASVKRIERAAFSGCTALKSIIIPATTVSISDDAFDGCTALKELIVDPQNQSYTSFQGKLMQKQQYRDPSIKTFTVNGFAYRITSENSVSLTNDGLYSGEIIIPPTVEYAGKTYQVTSINGAFYNSSNLVSVRVPASISNLGSNFGDAPESIHITIDAKNPNFTVVDDVVFNKNKTTLVACKGKKTQYEIPSSVTKIGSFAFYNCKSLKSLVIPSSVTTIEGQAFMSCTGLTTLEIPNSVTSIGEYALSSNPRLTSVTLPTSIKTIENGLFIECTGFKSFTIPSSVTTIKSGAFEACSNLTSITIPSSVTSFGQFAFAHCTSLKSVILPPSISKIERQLFQKCTGLTSISIPPSVTSIETLAFLDCHSLTSVTIPENVSTIAENAFSNCIALKQIDVNSKNPYFASLEGVLFSKDKTRLIMFPAQKAGPYVIPNSVKTIESNAFSNCMDLTSITLPNSVTTIGNAAFGACSNLKEILLPTSVQSIGNSAFSGCVKLTKVSIPASLTTIGGSAFRLCPIEEYRVDGNNPSFASVDGVFFNKDKTTLIACPVSKSGQYTIPSTVTIIDNYAFYGCSTLASIILPSSVTSIKMSAFSNCTSLKEVHCQMKKPLNCVMVFSNTDTRTATLYVPKGSKELYASAREWSSFGTILEE